MDACANEKIRKIINTTCEHIKRTRGFSKRYCSSVGNFHLFQFLFLLPFGSTCSFGSGMGMSVSDLVCA
jgi:hypothetical protein